ncbi:hypothetical protein LINPERHAP1_LOCUS39880, partial [Linum perenne]
IIIIGQRTKEKKRRLRGSVGFGQEEGESRRPQLQSEQGSFIDSSRLGLLGMTPFLVVCAGYLSSSAISIVWPCAWRIYVTHW